MTTDSSSLAKEKTLMEAKTYDRQTGKFLATIAQNMPEMSADVMQSWIENPKALQKFLKGLCPARSWREEDGVIYFSVTRDGTKGEAWIKRLEDNGFRVGNYAKKALRSPDFKPTKGVTEVAVLDGTFFTSEDRVTKKIRAEAKRRKFTTPNAEVACLIREKFTDREIEEMGLSWIVAMHELIKDPDGDSVLLHGYSIGVTSWFGTYFDMYDCRWPRAFGFAFAVSSQ